MWSKAVTSELCRNGETSGVGAWNQHPDFLILHPRRALLVIEVKDWKLENIRSMDRLTATLQVDGRGVRKSNPLEQAKQYAHRVGRLLESDPALVGEPGTSYQGRLVFPWGYGVVLANISRKAFAGTQEQLARSMGEGHRVIHGVAGSGGTYIVNGSAASGVLAAGRRGRCRCRCTSSPFTLRR